MQQKWRGVPVYGLHLLLNQREDALMLPSSAEGYFLGGVEEDLQSERPTISQDAARQIALDHNGDNNSTIETVSMSFTALNWKLYKQQLYFEV